ncbi:MAG: hypothetical protein M0Q41_13360 [Bacteroidales bacterium]|nr:hypothetical protein [Acholeplasmataceae bacterium]MCK9449945.1 hypothetical protein [Bacteroidales bacterium]
MSKNLFVTTTIEVEHEVSVYFDNDEDAVDVSPNVIRELLRHAFSNERGFEEHNHFEESDLEYIFQNDENAQRELWGVENLYLIKLLESLR